MLSRSKEENILKLLLENSPLKEWHFEEIVKESKVTRAVANKWLKRYVQEGLLNRVKPKERFPYFIVGANNVEYRSRKRIYALDQLFRSGLIKTLIELKSAKTVILFGSMIKGDWYKDSDIDIFIFGNPSDFDKKVYEEKLGRNIELHVFETRAEIREVKSGLMANVINGFAVKGQIQDIAEVS